MSLTILFVEDHQTVAEAVRDILEAEGWRVRLCPDAAAGRGEIEGAAHYDVLILDHELPGGASGVELVRFARGLGHRRRTPAVVVSASHVESAARAAGADAFLRKPQDMGLLVLTIRGLVGRGRGG